MRVLASVAVTGLVVLLGVAGEKPLQGPLPKQGPQIRLWKSPVPYPEGMLRYESARYTQSIFVLNDRHTIRRVPILGLKRKWHQSGGMLGIEGWHSEKYKLIPQPPQVFIANKQVLNGLGYYQTNRGIDRIYPNGTRFDDILSHDGVVFEHRSREKINGQWKSSILYKNTEARPRGYNGLSVSCASCHEEAGTGGYAEGLIPGGDTVLSDPLDWNVARGYLE